MIDLRALASLSAFSDEPRRADEQWGKSDTVANFFGWEK